MLPCSRNMGHASSGGSSGGSSSRSSGGGSVTPAVCRVSQHFRVIPTTKLLMAALPDVFHNNLNLGNTIPGAPLEIGTNQFSNIQQLWNASR